MTKAEPEDLTSITLRFDSKTMARIDEHVTRIRKNTPTGVHVTRTDALRNLVEAGLAASK